jgi:hypothetical protein
MSKGFVMYTHVSASGIVVSIINALHKNEYLTIHALLKQIFGIYINLYIEWRYL